MGENDTEDNVVSSAMSRHSLSLSRRYAVRAFVYVPVGPREEPDRREEVEGAFKAD